jgi:hypothetical protein
MKRFFIFSGVFSLAVVLVSALVLAQGAKFALRVDAGATSSYTDKAGNVWLPDKYYSKGGGYGFLDGDTVDRWTTTKIDGTADPRIYQTERYGMSGFVAEVPAGKYTVRLHFAETYEDIAVDGPRVFDVKIQGVQVAQDFDVAKAAGGNFKALIKEFNGIVVTGDVLQIGFVAKQQNPEINGVEILAE